MVFLVFFLDYVNFRADLLTGFIIFLFMFVCYFAVSILWNFVDSILYHSIIVTPDGIWFHSYGKCFYPWDSMITFGKKGVYWGIMTKEPDITSSHAIGKWLYKPEHYQNFIPIDDIVRTEFLDGEHHEDIDRLRQQTEFGRELAYFAPHLFDDHDNNDYDIVDTDRYQQEDNRK